MRKSAAVALAVHLTACGGGGGSSSGPPDPGDPSPAPTQLAIIDAVPSSTSSTDPQLTDMAFAHRGTADIQFTLSGDCPGFAGTTLRRQLVDLSATDFDELLDHRISCDLPEDSSVTFIAEGTDSNDAVFEARHSISTTTAAPAGLIVQRTVDTPRSAVNSAFTDYVSGALLEDLDLPGAVEALIGTVIDEIADSSWDNLADPDALYAVRSERVSYLSSTPEGSASTALSGLVAYPRIETDTAFSPRATLLVLMHATGSTPSEQDPADAWFILANHFASRGYLVVAADNYGRGGTGEFPETYLLANRTARTTKDLIDAVLASGNYRDVYAGNDATIIGYSQGGHSAIALLQHLVSHRTNLSVGDVYAGGAPHDLYSTVRGVMAFLDGACDGNDYCRYVDAETTVPYATDRILPGLTRYTDVGFTLEELVDGDELSEELVSGFLADDPAYDRLKTILQLNSFTNLLEPGDSFTGAAATVKLYHSEFDRLVPYANTASLANLLQGAVTVDFDRNRCNGNGYGIIFDLTDKVGVLHTLCALSVLDEAFDDLK